MHWKMTRSASAIQKIRQHLSIHPNPVNHSVTIYSNDKTVLTIFDQFGSPIQEIQLKNGENVFNISEFNSRMYTFRAENGA